MISFRYHIASLVAVLLALAAGIALGAGPLQRQVVAAEAPGGASPGDSADVAALEQEQAFSDAFVASMAGNLVNGQLAGRSVTVLTLPDAPPEALTSLLEMLGASGASVASTLQLSTDLVSASSKQLVDELGGQLETSTKGLKVPTGASSYERFGLLMARALGSTAPGGGPLDSPASAILAGLTTAGLVSSAQPVKRTSNLFLVLAGPAISDHEQAQATATIVTTILRALDGRTGGVVVAGLLSAAGTDGVIAAVRADPATAKVLSTVDSVDHPAGAVATVLAMAEQAGGGSGQYGAGPRVTGPRPGPSGGGE